MAKSKPRRFEDFPEYVQANDRLTQLKTLESDLERQLERRAEDRDERAKKMVEGLLAGNPQSLPALRPEADIREELVVTRKAIALQEEKLTKLKRELNQTICEGFLLEHRQLVKEMAEKRCAATAAAYAEQQFRWSLEKEGLSPDAVLQPMNFASEYEIGNPNAALHIWLEECCRLGYLKGNEAFLADVRFRDPNYRQTHV